MKRVYKIVRIEAPYDGAQPDSHYAALRAGTWSPPDGFRVVSHSVNWTGYPHHVSLLFESTAEESEPDGGSPYR